MIARAALDAKGDHSMNLRVPGSGEIKQRPIVLLKYEKNYRTYFPPFPQPAVVEAPTSRMKEPLTPGLPIRPQGARRRDQGNEEKPALSTTPQVPGDFLGPRWGKKNGRRKV